MTRGDLKPGDVITWEVELWPPDLVVRVEPLDGGRIIVTYMELDGHGRIWHADYDAWSPLGKIKVLA